jgi:hypothetical protein
LSLPEFFDRHCRDTPEANSLLPRFLKLVAQKVKR